MKHALIIITKYRQHKSPNAICLDAVLDVLLKDYGWDATIVTSGYREGDLVTDVGPRKVVEICDPFGCTMERLSKAHPRVSKVISRLLSVMVPSMLMIWRHRAWRYLKDGLREQSYDLLISNSLPFDNHELALRYKTKRRSIPWVVYILDPCSDNPITRSKNPFINMWRRRRENTIYRSSDAIVALENIQVPDVFQDKVHKVGIPLLSETPLVHAVHDSQRDGSGKIRQVVYGGSFLNGVRTPEEFIEIFDCIEDVHGGESVRFCFYTNIADRVNAELCDRARSSDMMIVNGYVDKGAMNEIIRDSCAVLSIGNLEPLQIPSKVIEYMSFRKPIIHLSYSQHDPTLPYLREYPCACVLNVNDGAAYNARRLIDFLSCPCAFELSRWRPTEEFTLACVPSYTAGVINRCAER